MHIRLKGFYISVAHSVILAISLFLATDAKCEEQAAAKPPEQKRSIFNRVLIDKVAPPLIKSMARVYVRTADIEEAKLINMDKIVQMDEAKYKKKLTKICNDLEGTGIDKRIGIRADMGKKEAAALIESYTRDDILKLINDIPNESISTILRIYLERHPREAPKDKKELARRLVLLKDKIIKKIYNSRQKDTY